MEALPEPWLRGPLTGVHALVSPVLYSFQQAREDIATHTEDLTTDQIWATPHRFGSVGFHIRHIARSTDRLITYLEGKELSIVQMAQIAAEHEPGETREQLLTAMDNSFRRAELLIRTLDPARLAEPRAVGRKRLPTTAIGLLTHIAEHTQRHAGQAISAANWARVPG